MSNKFSFSYRRYIAEDPKTGKLLEVFRPTIPIQISYRGKISLHFQALVDSGSDRNLFPAGLGEFIGIDIKSGKVREIEGIGKHIISSHTHKISLIFNNIRFKTDVDFSYEHQVPLLGREGFFDLFKRIDFREKKKMVDFKV